MHHCANKICQKVQVEVGMPNKLPQFYPRFKSYRTRIKQSLYDNCHDLKRLMMILKFSRFQQYWNHQLTRWWPGPIMVLLWELWWLIMREMKTPTSTKDKSSYSIHVFGMWTRRQGVQSPGVRQYWHYVCVITSMAMISTKQNALNVSILNIMVMKSTE